MRNVFLKIGALGLLLALPLVILADQVFSKDVTGRRPSVGESFDDAMRTWVKYHWRAK